MCVVSKSYWIHSVFSIINLLKNEPAKNLLQYIGEMKSLLYIKILLKIYKFPKSLKISKKLENTRDSDENNTAKNTKKSGR